MNLIAAVLHVNQRAVVAVKEFGITRAPATVAGFLKDEMLVTIAGENAGIRLALNKVGIGLLNVRGERSNVPRDSAALYEAEDKSKTCNPDIAKTYIERAIFPYWGGGPKNFFK